MAGEEGGGAGEVGGAGPGEEVEERVGLGRTKEVSGVIEAGNQEEADVQVLYLWYEILEKVSKYFL